MRDCIACFLALWLCKRASFIEVYGDEVVIICQIEGLSVRVMAHNHRRLKVMNRPGDGSEVIVLV